MNKLKSFWDNVEPFFAHLQENDRGIDLKPGSPILKKYKELFIDKLDFKDKVVIDYGIGGGWLGKYLFENEGIKEYIGIDISDRSLKIAEKNIGKGIFYLADNVKSFKVLEADIFVSLACIQHFPTKEYFDTFLKMLNESNIKDLVLQIRYNENTIFNDTYGDLHTAAYACQTNGVYLKNKLSNYGFKHISKVYEKTNYQYFVFGKKV